MKLKNSIALALAFILMTISSSAMAVGVGRQHLHGHIPPAVRNGAHDQGRYTSTKKMWLAIEIPWRNQSDLETLIKNIYDPTSSQYHHYLSTAEFNDSFAPTQEDYQAVMDYMKSKGLKVTNTHSNHLLVDVEGAPADVEVAFNVELHTYMKADGSTFYAPDREPSLDLDTPINHIGGLDNSNPPHPLYKQRPAGVMPSPRVIRNEAGQSITEEGTYGNGTGTANCSGCYIGNDLRDAYLPGVTLNGSGQVSSIIAVDGYFASDITTYLSKVGLPNNVPIQNVLVDGFDGTVHNSTGNGENSLDIEQQLSIAQGLSKLMVYEGSANIDDDINKVATDNIAKTTSVSYGWGPDTTLSSIGQEFAAQGQSLFIASGDGGAYVGGQSGDSASENPYVTVVGGTDLFTTGPGGTWQSESAWVDGGGGIGLDYAIPGYQGIISMSTNGGSSTQRNVPDVAMNANFNYLIITENPSTGSDEADNIGGTSASTPLWAAFTALVNQQTAAGGKPTVGFINPAVYNIAKGANYTADFHDIVTGNNNNSGNGGFNAVTGYDLATGLGSPKGQGLITDLSQAAGAPTATATGTPTPVVASTWRVRAGGVAYTDSQSHVWAADENYGGGGQNSSTAAITSALPASTDQALYQGEHYENPTLTYTFHVPTGSYQVTLKFAELFDNGAGERIENISINGTQVLANFDIYSAAGGLDKAIDEVFSNIASSNGVITISFSAASGSPDGNAKVDALQIVPQPSTPTNTPTFTQTPTKTNTPTNTFTATNTPTFTNTFTSTSTATNTSTPTPIVASTWRVNAGGPAYTDCQNNVWAADENFTGGASNGNANVITGALPCSTDQALYQTEHWGANSFSYTFNVPAGSYQVTLKFAEIFDGAAGQRVMNITINGTQVLSNLDIFAEVGANKADDKVFSNISPVNGQIVVVVATTANSSDVNAKIDALQIVPQPATPTFTATATKTFTNTSTATLTSTATSTATASPTSTATSTFSSTPTFTSTSSNTSTFTPTATSTSTNTSTFTFTATPTNTGTTPPTFTFTNTGTATSTFTFTATTTSTATSSPTSTATVTNTNTNTFSPTATATATNSFTSTFTPTFTSTLTNTNTATSTATNSFTATSTNTATKTNTPVPPTSTFTFTATSTPTFTFTPTRTNTPVPTSTFTFTATSTNTKAPTATFTFTFTPTKTSTPVPPTATPTSASACSGVAAWNGNFVAYPTGAKVTYNNELYSCIQAHTSEPNWMPNVVPALWKDLGPCSNLVAAVTSNNVIQSAVAGPNISRGFEPVRFFIQLKQTAQVTVNIFTPMGQLVAHTSFFGNTGMNNWLWDVQNAAHSMVSSGLYIYAIQATSDGSTETKTGKIVIIH